MTGVTVYECIVEQSGRHRNPFAAFQHPCERHLRVIVLRIGVVQRKIRIGIDKLPEGAFAHGVARQFVRKAPVVGEEQRVAVVVFVNVKVIVAHFLVAPVGVAHVGRDNIHMSRT